MRTRLHPADATLLAVVCCFAVGVFAAWALHGFSWSSSHPHKAAAPVVKPRKAPTSRPRVAAPRPRPRPRPRHHPPAHLTLTATRGASWISVRAGSPSGRTLYEGLLTPRQHITLPGKRFVARIQGGSNLDAVLEGRRVDLAPYEMRDVLITAGGIRLLSGQPPPRIVAS